MPRNNQVKGWTNWAGNQSAPNARVLQPRSEEELKDILQSANGPIRISGAGHSFTPIVSTSGTVVNLDHMGGVISTDPKALTATVRAGGRLKALSEELDAHGLAFRNLGDINVQSLAGATATATHGTGESLGCLSSEITAVRFMCADGSILEGSHESNPDLLSAAQVSMGALGVLLEATVNVCPSYNLHRRTWVEPIEAILSDVETRWKTHRNFEIFYIPFSDYGVNILHDATEAVETERPPSEDEAALATIRKIRGALKWSRTLRRKVLAAGLKRIPAEDIIGASWKVLASPRNTLFNEMEYHLPVETAIETFKSVVSYIETHQPNVYFPIEVRKTAGDTAWLSPFQGAPRISIAVHVPADEPYEWFFKGVEPIFRAAGGRPHWGKLHSLGHEDLAALYPDFDKFLDLRQKLDPEGRFVTPPLARLWGISAEGED